jgi:AraC-like DNA-binding protein
VEVEERTRRTRIDALPENTEYADNGCDLYPSCLHCPLPRCRYEEPGGAAAMLRSGRDESIVRLATERGLSVDNLAAMFGLSRRTVFRVLRQARGRGPGSL